MSSAYKIAIIGAGVCGATVAFRLQEQFGNSVSITIFSEEFSPNTTGIYIHVNNWYQFQIQIFKILGDISAGLWSQYNLGNTPVERGT